MRILLRRNPDIPLVVRGCYSDNTAANSGDGLGPTYADDDIGGIHFPRVKLIHGADGVNAGDVASGNPLPVVDATGNTLLTTLSTAVKAEDAASAGGDPGFVVMAVRQDVPAAKSGTDGDYEPLTVVGGRLATIATVSGTVTITASDLTTIAGAIKAEDVASAGGDPGMVVMGMRQDTPAAVSSTDGDYEPLRIVGGRLAASSEVTGAALTALQLLDNSSVADDAAFTPGTTGVTMAGFTADETATDSVDEGDGGAARMTLDRKQIVAEYVHAAAGGSSSYSFLSTAAVQSAEVKGSPGKVFSIQFFNNGADEMFVRLYNQTGAPAGGDNANIIWRGMIPGNAAGAGVSITFPKGKQFTTGIGLRVTGAVADTDTTALTANAVMGNVDYA